MYKALCLLNSGNVCFSKKMLFITNLGKWTAENELKVWVNYPLCPWITKHPHRNKKHRQQKINMILYTNTSMEKKGEIYWTSNSRNYLWKSNWPARFFLISQKLSWYSQSQIEKYAIRGLPLKWFTSYLKNRQQ